MQVIHDSHPYHISTLNLQLSIIAISIHNAILLSCNFRKIATVSHFRLVLTKFWNWLTIFFSPILNLMRFHTCLIFYATFPELVHHKSEESRNHSNRFHIDFRSYFTFSPKNIQFCGQNYPIGCSVCQGDNHLGKNFLPPINTRSPVVELVKLMPWRQAKSLMKIPVC